jgi:hypothetical protein
VRKGFAIVVVALLAVIAFALVSMNSKTLSSEEREAERQAEARRKYEECSQDAMNAGPGQYGGDVNRAIDDCRAKAGYP